MQQDLKSGDFDEEEVSTFYISTLDYILYEYRKLDIEDYNNILKEN